MHIDTPEKKRNANALSIALIPSYGMELSESDSVGDALVLLEEDVSKYGYHLGGRRVDPNGLNIDIIRSWVATCTRNHPLTCAVHVSDRLQRISLIDVHCRRVVLYPSTACEYVALSYVWGPERQVSYSTGSRLPQLPQTIEDAMTVTKDLGKRYIWVDSLCVDQDNETEKLAQIAMMSEIYRGAWATIIAISGKSAGDGLSRVGSKARMYPQLSCTVGGQRLVGTMMNLSCAIRVGAWGSRAWTLQEALLSPRSIYMGDQQVYFECNAMQCCESLDESKSWMHQVYRDPKDYHATYTDAAAGSGVLRSPGLNEGRLEAYAVLVWLYCRRFMSHQSDGLNAFSGITQYFQDYSYSKGFYWGLPAEDLNWALLWYASSAESGLALRRRKGFPSWAWAG